MPQLAAPKILHRGFKFVWLFTKIKPWCQSYTMKLLQMTSKWCRTVNSTMWESILKPISVSILFTNIITTLTHFQDHSFSNLETSLKPVLFNLWNYCLIYLMWGKCTETFSTAQTSTLKRSPTIFPSLFLASMLVGDLSAEFMISSSTSLWT